MTSRRRVPRLLACVVMSTAVLAGCSDRSSTDSGSDSTTTAADSGTAPTTSATSRIDLEAFTVTTELDEPVAVTAVQGSGGALVVAEKGGRVRLLEPDPQGPLGAMTIREDVLIDISDEVTDATGERGLLGIAVDDELEHLYLSYTAGSDGMSRVAQYRISGGLAGEGRLQVDEASRRILLEVDQPYANHNGGHIEFGPDGALYLGLGDGGSAGDPGNRAQDPDSSLGKLLRVDPESDGGPEIWSYGLRNPWRFNFDPVSGDLWVADVGQDTSEEINVVRGPDAGRNANFGWNAFEGTEPFPAGGELRGDGELIEPVHTYGRDRGCSVTGGVVVHGEELEDLGGAFLFADLCEPGVSAVTVDGDDVAVRHFPLAVERAVGFGTDEFANVYVVTLDGELLRLRQA